VSSTQSAMMVDVDDDTFIDSLVGRHLDEATRRATAAGWLVRPCTPGSMLTMDYREGRVNLEHDPDGVVTRAWVG
jgi:hypothetical protein